jgi:hypothetical protein
VLSIGKLARGQASYYLQHAQRRVARPQSVASGIEDYYLAGPEAPGPWMGRLAGSGANITVAGLTSTVTPVLLTV